MQCCIIPAQSVKNEENMQRKCAKSTFLVQIPVLDIHANENMFNQTVQFAYLRVKYQKSTKYKKNCFNLSWLWNHLMVRTS